ncbi:unnamed protein product [Lampetra fluviatilis]
MPRAEPDANEAPGLPTPSSRHRLHVERLRLRDEPALVMAQPLVVCAGVTGVRRRDWGRWQRWQQWPLASLPRHPELRVRAWRMLRTGLLEMERHLPGVIRRLQPRIFPIPGLSGES